MKKTKKILAVFLTLLTIFSYTSLFAGAVFNGTGTSKSGISGSVSDDNFQLKSTYISNTCVGYQFSVIDAFGETKTVSGHHSTVSLYRSWNAYKYDEKSVVRYNKVDLIKKYKNSLQYDYSTDGTNITGVDFYVGTGTTFTANGTSYTLYASLPNPDKMKDWQGKSTNMDVPLKILGYANGVDDLGYNERVLIEPIWEVGLNKHYQAVTLSEIMMFGIINYGGSSYGGSPDFGVSFGTIAYYTNNVWPNALYTNTELGLTNADRTTIWSSTGEINYTNYNDYNSYLNKNGAYVKYFKNILCQGYGVGIFYIKDLEPPVLTVRYFADGGVFSTSNSTYKVQNDEVWLVSSNKVYTQTAGLNEKVATLDAVACGLAKTAIVNNVERLCTFNGWDVLVPKTAGSSELVETGKVVLAGESYDAEYLNPDIRLGSTQVFLRARWTQNSIVEILYTSKSKSFVDNNMYCISGYKIPTNESPSERYIGITEANPMYGKYTYPFHRDIYDGKATDIRLAKPEQFGLRYPGYQFCGWQVFQGQKFDKYLENLDQNYSVNKIISGISDQELRNKVNKLNNNQADLQLILCAYWQPKQYTITYDPNGGQFDSTIQIYNAHQSSHLLSMSPTYTDFTFKGWMVVETEKDSNWEIGEIYEPGDAFSGMYGDVTLRAIWQSNYVPVVVTVRLDDELWSALEDLDYNNQNANIILETTNGTQYIPDEYSGGSYVFKFKRAANGTINIGTVVITAKKICGVSVDHVDYSSFILDGPKDIDVDYYSVEAKNGDSVNIKSVSIKSGNNVNSKPMYASSAVLKGSDFTIDAALENGSVFHNWIEDSVTGDNSTIYNKQHTVSKIDTAHSYTAYGTLGDYTVTYNPNGGKWPDKTTANKSLNYTKINGFTVKDDLLSKNGYTFGEWEITSGEGSFASLIGEGVSGGEVFSSGTYGNVVLTAQYIPNKLTLKYNANGGTVGGKYVLGSNNTICGSGVVSLAYSQLFDYDVAQKLDPDTKFNLTKTGYKFGGWNSKSDMSGTTYNTSTAYKPSTLYSDIRTANNYLSSTEVFAKWTPIKYTVEYYVNGVIQTSLTQTCTYDVSYSYKSLPSTTGYTVGGWYDDASCSGTKHNAGDTFKNLTATDGTVIKRYASSTANSSTLKVDPNGGTWQGSGAVQSFAGTYNLTKYIPIPVGKEVVADFESKCDISFISQLSALPFKEWTKSSNFKGQMSSLTAAANYTYGSVANAVDTITAQYNKATVTMPNGDREGYILLGWTDDNNSEVVKYTVGTTVQIDRDTTFYAIWEPITYTVEYYVNGTIQTSLTQTCTYDVSYTYAAIPTAEGHTADGWYDINDGSYTPETQFVNLTTKNGDTIKRYAFSNVKVHTVSITTNLNNSVWTNLSDPDKTYVTLSNGGAVITAKSYSSGVYTFDVPYGTTVSIRARENTTSDSYKSYGTSFTVTGDMSRTVDYYSVTLNKGTGITSVSGAGTFLKGSDVTINAAVSTGYTWSQWTGTVVSSTKQYIIRSIDKKYTETANAAISYFTVTIKVNKDDAIWSDLTDSTKSVAELKNVKTTYKASTYKNGVYTFLIPYGTTVSLVAKANGTTGQATVYGSEFTVTSDITKTVDYYTVTLTKDEGIESVSGGGIFLKGASTTIDATVFGVNEWKQWIGTVCTSVKKYTINNITKPYEEKATTVRDTYTVDYNANGGDKAPDSQVKSHNETIQIAPESANPKRTGYVFVEWNTAKDGSGQSYNPGADYTNNASVIMFAQWSPISYQVKYNGNGATSGTMSNSIHIYDVAKPLTANAYKREFTVTYLDESGKAITGYTTSATKASATFNGWAQSTSGDVVYADKAEVINLADVQDTVINVYAKWTDGSITVPDRPKDGYDFEGWIPESDPDTDPVKPGEKYTPSEDITLIPVYTPHTYTIRYHENFIDGNDLREGHDRTVLQTVTYSETETFKVLPSQWTNSFHVTFRDDDGEVYYEKDVNASAIQWMNASVKTSADKTYSFGQELPCSLTTVNNAVIDFYCDWKLGTVTAPEKDKDGYDFEGWEEITDPEDNIVPPGTEITPMNDEVYDPVYNTHSYTIVYHENFIDGDDIKSDRTITQRVSYSLSEQIKLKSCPWENGFNVVFRNEDGTEYAKEYAKSTPVKWMNASVKANATKTYSFDSLVSSDWTSVNGAEIHLYCDWQLGSVKAPDKDKEGYEFDGWDDPTDPGDDPVKPDDVITPTDDEVYDPVFSPVSYTIRYHENFIDGNNIKSDRTVDQRVVYSETGTIKTLASQWTNGFDVVFCNEDGTEYKTLRAEAKAKKWMSKSVSGPDTVTYSFGETIPCNWTTESKAVIDLYCDWELGSVKAPDKDKDGYDFEGWDDPDDPEDDPTVPETVITPTDDEVYDPVYTPHKYTIVYHENFINGTDIRSDRTVSQNVTYNEKSTVKALVPEWTNGFTVTFVDENNKVYAEKRAEATPNMWMNDSIKAEADETYAFGSDIPCNLTTVNGAVIHLYCDWTLGSVKAPEIEKEGYTFDGWDDTTDPNDDPVQPDDVITPIQDMEYDPIFTPNYYIIRYHENFIDGNDIKSDRIVEKNVIFNSTDTFAALTPEWTNGFDVVFRDENGDEYAKARAEATAKQWMTKSVKDDTVSVYAFGEMLPCNWTAENGKVFDLYCDWQLGSVKAPDKDKDGYDFEGWEDPEDPGDDPVKPDDVITPTDDEIYDPVYTPHTYIIRYHENFIDGNRIRSNKTVEQTVTYNETKKINLKSLPSDWKNSIFVTFYEEDGTTVYVVKEAKATANKWMSTDVKSEDSVMYAFGSSVNSNWTTENGKVFDLYVDWILGSVVPPEKEKPGYTPEGWEDPVDPDDPIPPNVPIVPDDDEEYVPIYTPIIFAIECDKNGGEGGSDEFFEHYTVAYHSDDSDNPSTVITAVPELPEKTGYIFDGYYTDPVAGEQIVDKDGNILVDPDYFTDDSKVYAHWTPIQYQIHYDGNGATEVVMPNSIHTYDVESALLANTYVNGSLAFAGWNTKTDGTGDSYGDKQSILNLTDVNGAVITLYAQWIESTPLRLEPIEPNAAYKKGDDVVTSFLLINETGRDRIPSDNVTITFRVYDGSGVIKVVTMDNTIVPTGDQQLLYFKWTVPANATAIKIVGDITEGGRTYGEKERSYTLTTNGISRDNNYYSETNHSQKEGQVEYVETNIPPVTGDVTSTWSVWEYENDSFVKKTYGITVTGMAVLEPDDYATKFLLCPKCGTGNLISRTKCIQCEESLAGVPVGTRGGYDTVISAESGFTTGSGYIAAPDTAYTESQSAVALRPEYFYNGTYDVNKGIYQDYLTLENTGDKFEFLEDLDLGDRISNIPLWYRFGTYQMVVSFADLWTPAGMVSCNVLTNTIPIVGNANDDDIIG